MLVGAAHLLPPNNSLCPSCPSLLSLSRSTVQSPLWTGMMTETIIGRAPEFVESGVTGSSSGVLSTIHRKNQSVPPARHLYVRQTLAARSHSRSGPRESPSSPRGRQGQRLRCRGWVQPHATHVRSAFGPILGAPAAHSSRLRGRRVIP